MRLRRNVKNLERKYRKRNSGSRTEWTWWWKRPRQRSWYRVRCAGRLRVSMMMRYANCMNDYLFIYLIILQSLIYAWFAILQLWAEFEPEGIDRVLSGEIKPKTLITNYGVLRYRVRPRPKVVGCIYILL